MDFLLPSWMYDLMIYVYALSLLFYISDFVESNRMKKRMALGLLYFVWFLQTLFFMTRMLNDGLFSWFTMFETLFFYAWLLLTISLVITRWFKMDLIVFGVNVLAFIVSVINLFSKDTLRSISETEMMRNELIFVHVSMAIASYIAFTVAAVLALFYLWLHARLKQKKWSNVTRRLPDLMHIEKYMFYCVVWGVPLLIINVLLAIIWNFQQANLIQWNDPKIWNTLLILLAYSFYIYKKISRTVTGVQLARYNLFAMSFVVLNFVVSNWLSDFHNWIWS